MQFIGDDGDARVTTGVIGALELDRDGVLPHERTLPKAKSDRLELLRATRANFDPIWGISLAPGLSELLEPDGEPLAVAHDRDGVRHELYPVTDPGTARERSARRCRARRSCSPTATTASRPRAPTATNGARTTPGRGRSWRWSWSSRPSSSACARSTGS